MTLRGPRYSVAIQVSCATRDAFLANRITNISRGGVFIETVLPLHADVDLTFSLPGSEVTIGAKGRVVWTYDMRKDSFRLRPGSGIRFVEIAEDQRRQLEECLSRLTPSLAPGTPPRAEAT
jgi:uncharacterized protein (TIGR02266 family)